MRTLRRSLALVLPILGATLGGTLNPTGTLVSYRDDASANARAAAVAEKYMPRWQALAGYAGTAIVHAGLEVSFKGNSPQLPSSIDGVPIKIRKVERSSRDLEKALVTLDERVRTSAGSLLSAWMPDYHSNTVKIIMNAPIGSSHANRQDLEHLLQGIPATSISIEKVPRTFTGAGRTNDWSPFYGANALTRVNVGNTCTSWFNVNSPQGQRVITAAHCGSGTWKVSNGSTVGTTYSSAWSGSVDAQSIMATGGPFVWADPNSSTRVVKTAYTQQAIGTLACTDGYVDREVCNVEVWNDSARTTYDGVTLTDVVYAHQKANLPAFTRGNSGGPVYSFVSGGVAARGMVISKDTIDASYGFYGKQQYVTALFGATIKTG